MDLYGLGRRFEEWCKRAGGALRRGRNYAGEEVLMCIRPARGSYVTVQGTEAETAVGIALTAARFRAPPDFETVFDGGDGWVRTGGFARYGLRVDDPEVVSLVPEEKRIYIGSGRSAPRWARIEAEGF